jgi:hypothetical protein
MTGWQSSKLYFALRGVASLWLGALLLVLLLLAMACATVYESTHGTEQALHVFYRARWFHGLLFLLGLNILAAVVVRLPFTRSQVGFVLTHVGILAILLGALTTKFLGLEGQVGLAEGDSTGYFGTGENTLTVTNRGQQTKSALDLESDIFGGFVARNLDHAPSLALNNVRFKIDRYLPDSTLADQVTNDAPHVHPAVELSLSKDGGESAAWVFQDQTTPFGPTTATLRIFADDAELQRMASAEDPEKKQSLGSVRVVYEGVAHEVDIEKCQDTAVLVEGANLSVRVLRYLPHATVGTDNEVSNASPQPVNPAIEVELTSANVVEKRVAFARYPDFQSMHATDSNLNDVKIVFVMTQAPAPRAPVEVLAGPSGDLYVRFTWEGTNSVTHKLTPGLPVESPWPGMQLTLLRYFDRARTTRAMVAVDSPRKNRVPAIRVSATAPIGTQKIWIQRRRPGAITVDDVTYDLIYDDKILPLGFTIGLERFRVGYYPGGRRPRSFESRVVFTDPQTGRAETRLISMNHPTKFGGYNFYQSSYSLEGSVPVSYLSVARDPGLSIVFAGYIATMTGMLLVFVARTRDRRRTQVALPHGGAVAAQSGPRNIPLVVPGAECCTGGTVDRRSESAHSRKPAQREAIH